MVLFDINKRRLSMSLLFFSLAIISLGVLVGAHSIIVVPKIHYGVKVRLGKRLPGVLYEGLHFKIPFIEEVTLISTELAEIEITAKFTTKDNLSLEAKGSLQYRPHPDIIEKRGGHKKKGVNKFISISEEIIRDGISEMVESILGGLGGQYTGEQFINHRHALKDIINSLLMMKKPLHLHHNRTTCTSMGGKCKHKDRIPANELIGFYDKHWKELKESLGAKSSKENSDVEQRYGIEIDAFALSRINFSPETEIALEQEKQAALRGKAALMKADLALEIRARLPDASAQVALDAADVTLDPKIRKEVISIQGEVGVLAGFLKKRSKK